MPNFYDPNVLKIDETLMRAPQSPQIPTGFGDRLKMANSNNLVMGMQPDEFAMMMGRFGASMMPADHPAGRFGQAVFEMGKQKYDQRMIEQSPERRLAEAKTRGLLGEGAPAPGSQAPVAGGVAPTSLSLQQLGENEGKYREWTLGPLSTQLLGEQVQGAKAETRYNNAAATRSEATLPYDIKRTQADTRIADVGANIAEATYPDKIAESKANLDKLKAETSLMRKQDRYYETTQVGIPQAQLGIQQGQLQLGHIQLEQNVMLKKSAELANLNQGLQNHIATVNDHTQKQITANPGNVGPIMFAAGRSLIDEGLKHIPSVGVYADVDPQGSGRAMAAQTLKSGVTYLVEGVNQSQGISAKIKATENLIRQLDNIKMAQPEMGAAIEAQLFGDGAPPIAGARKSAPIWKPWKSDEVFDPMTVYRMVRGKK